MYVKLAIGCFLLTIACPACKCDFNNKPVQVSKQGDVDTKTLRGSISKVCIENHSYYVWTYGYGETMVGGLAPALQDDGRPAPCVVEQERN
jgi:hypothetical protein